MSKFDYFKELNYRLRGLPEKERHNILKVYEELFQKAVENGKHEDEVAQSLGYPRVPNWDAQKETPSKEQEPSGGTIGDRVEKSFLKTRTDSDDYTKLLYWSLYTLSALHASKGHGILI